MLIWEDFLGILTMFTLSQLGTGVVQRAVIKHTYITYIIISTLLQCQHCTCIIVLLLLILYIIISACNNVNTALFNNVNTVLVNTCR